MTRKYFLPPLLTLAGLIFFNAMNFSYAGPNENHSENHEKEHQEQDNTHTSHGSEKEGSHGGKLLTDGNISIELAILEQGNASLFQAWISQNGKPVIDNTLDLLVELTRLDGELSRLKFKLENNVWISTNTIKEPHSFDIKVILNRSGQQHNWTFESHEGRVEISDEIAAKAGIKSETARSGIIKQTIVVYGKTVADPSKVSQVRARFPGTITNIKANIGDRVKEGDILAEIESNQSLKRYTLSSPLTGVITTRNGNPGELAQGQVLLTVANYDRLWVEYRIFPSQASLISAGQPVSISSGLHTSESVIKHLLPSNTGQPFMLARVPLDNTKGQWLPGLLLEGKIVNKKIQVPLVINNRALQTIQGNAVVFIQVGNRYEIRPLELGLSDGNFSEVIEGLNVGDQYVVDNSYLIKADLEKSGASHDH